MELRHTIALLGLVPLLGTITPTWAYRYSIENKTNLNWYITVHRSSGSDLTVLVKAGETALFGDKSGHCLAPLPQTQITATPAIWATALAQGITHIKNIKNLATVSIKNDGNTCFNKHWIITTDKPITVTKENDGTVLTILEPGQYTIKKK